MTCAQPAVRIRSSQGPRTQPGVGRSPLSPPAGGAHVGMEGKGSMTRVCLQQ